MAAEITTAVHLDIEIGGGNVCADIGTITVPVHEGDVVELPEVRKALGDLLKEAGEYLLTTGEMPYLTPTPSN